MFNISHEEVQIKTTMRYANCTKMAVIKKADASESQRQCGDPGNCIPGWWKRNMRENSLAVS